MGKTKVAIIGTVGLPANYGGFETLTEHLVEELQSDYDFTVYCSSKKYTKEERLKNYKGANLKYIPLEANGIQSIFYDTISIIHALFHSQVLMVLGVAGAWIFPFVRLFTNRKIIVSIDGIEWKRDKWSFLAKMYLWWAEKIAVRFSHIDISDNEAIQDYTAMRYKTLSRVIEYGANHTISYIQPAAEDFEKYTFLKSDYAVKVCRIEPENNVHVVLKAFEEKKDINLVMIGNWQNSEYGKNLKRTYSRIPNITLLDPIYDQRDLDLIRGNAMVYIHGHSAGGTNPSLVEAMYLSLPIMAFDVSYNRVTTENNAFYFSDSEDLLALLRNKKDSDFYYSSLKLKRTAERRYTWEKVSQKYSSLIQDAIKAERKLNVKPRVAFLQYKTLNELGLLHMQRNETFKN